MEGPDAAAGPEFHSKTRVMTNKGRDSSIRDHSGAEGVRSHRGTDGSKGPRRSPGLGVLRWSKRVKALKTPLQRPSYLGDQGSAGSAVVVLAELEG